MKRIWGRHPWNQVWARACRALFVWLKVGSFEKLQFVIVDTYVQHASTSRDQCLQRRLDQVLMGRPSTNTLCLTNRKLGLVPLGPVKRKSAFCQSLAGPVSLLSRVASREIAGLVLVVPQTIAISFLGWCSMEGEMQVGFFRKTVRGNIFPFIVQIIVQRNFAL